MTPQPLNRPCGVDVLAVLDQQLQFTVASDYNGAAQDHRELLAARAAIAEMIAAAKEVDIGSGGCPCPTCERLRKALAAVEGQP